MLREEEKAAAKLVRSSVRPTLIRRNLLSGLDKDGDGKLNDSEQAAAKEAFCAHGRTTRNPLPRRTRQAIR